MTKTTEKLGLIEQEIKEIQIYRERYLLGEISDKQFSDLLSSYKRSEERVKIKLRSEICGVQKNMEEAGYIKGNVLTK